VSTTWLDSAIDASSGRSGERRTRLDAFLAEPRVGVALALWLGLRAGDECPSQEAIVSQLLRDVAAIDGLLEAQINALIHEPPFQRLEAAWRSLRGLVDAVPEDVKIKVRVLSVSWLEIARDIERAIEFDQSHLFKKIYNAEFGMAGGEPFGLLIGDYLVSHQPRPDQKVDDVRVLRGLTQIAAASFAPFVAGVHPALLGLDSHRELERPLDLARTLRGVEYTTWRSLRDSEDARFLALTLPCVLVREPYRFAPERRDGFPFTEHCTKHSDHLWGNAAFAYARVVVNAFANWGWLADIRGVKRGEDSGGIVHGLPAPDHGTDTRGVAVRFPTEVLISDRRERALAEVGLTALCANPDSATAVFYSTPSLHAAPRFQDAEATLNAHLGSLMQYILCVSRIAHYVKVIGRDLTGSMVSVQQIEKRLTDWLHTITAASDSTSDELQARFPLREGEVSVREVPGKPGCFTSVFHLRPHFQLDQMTSSMRLVTQIVTER
jgi:type VI secretion system protein ImpD